jgi:hypothetical protein
MNIDELWDKYKRMNWEHEYAENGVINKQAFTEAISEILSLPVEAKVSQENGGHIETISESNEGRFKEKVNLLVVNGYKINSTHCGYADDPKYDFCDIWQAILIKE